MRMGKKHKAVSGEIMTVAGPWRDMLLVCRKCSRKLDGGFGPDRKESLPDAFKQVLRATGRRRVVRILEVGCLGVCPKDAVTVMRGAMPGEMLVVPEGLELAALAARLAAPPDPDVVA
jgi:predicted metal-binding protein